MKCYYCPEEARQGRQFCKPCFEYKVSLYFLGPSDGPDGELNLAELFLKNAALAFYDLDQGQSLDQPMNVELAFLVESACQYAVALHNQENRFLNLEAKK